MMRNRDLKPRLESGNAIEIIAFVMLGFAVGGCSLGVRPTCHKAVESSFRMWMNDKGTTVFPNVGGRSQDSLRVIREEMGSSTIETNYNYVPGLREGDPGQLVLLYLNRPTRWIWHEQHRSFLSQRGWIVVPLAFKFYGRRPGTGPGEFSELVGTSEFKKRLQDTLDFVRTNERPNWQTVIQEHSEFLRSLND